MKTFIYIFIFLFCVMGYSQSKGPIRQSSQNPFWELQSRYIEIQESNIAMGEAPNSIESVEGSPYIPENFTKGSIYLNEKLIQKNVLLRYNMYSDEIEIKDGFTNGEVKAVIKDPQIFARFGERSFVFAPYLNDIERGGYFSPIASGEIYDLYKKETVRFTPLKQLTAANPSESAKFKKDIEYFLVSKKGNFFKIPKIKNKLLRTMDEKKTAIKNFIEAKNLNLDKESDIIEFFNYYNSILLRKS